MEVECTALEGVRILSPKKFADERGFFAETYTVHALQRRGISVDFVQDNHSLSYKRGTIRGLHYQVPPFAQDKLVRVLRGAVLDLAVDLRRGSPSFGKHVAVILSAENFRQTFVPIGFAHGFCTLEPDTEVLYKVSNYYSAAHERGILWNDPQLGIKWPIQDHEAVLSDKDQRHPFLRNTTEVFA